MELLHRDIKINRRHFTAILLQAAVVMGCTPMRLILHDSGISGDATSVIRAFMQTVIPGADIGEKEVGYLFDPAYPFYSYVSIFISDLDKTAARLNKGKRFTMLRESERKLVIIRQLKEPLVNRLYSTAIWFTQVICFTGMSRSDRSCPVIGFEPELPEIKNIISYTNPGDFTGRSVTANGNLN